MFKRLRMQALPDWTTNHIWITAILLFLLSFVCRFVLNLWNGGLVVTVYPDELRYFHIARNIAEQGEILIRDMPTDYQKILYSLVISPAFLMTGNPILQLKIVSVLNCVIMSSVIFPVTLLVKKLTVRKPVILLTMLLTLTLPDLAFSTTLMSEVLYLPLVIWLVYLILCALTEARRSRRIGLFFVFGAVNYLAYLVKEISAAYLLAAAFLLVIQSVIHKKPLRNTISSLLYLTAGFLILFVIMKLTLFHNLGNSYQQTDPSVLSSPYVCFYLIYSAIVLLTAACLSFYVLPVLFPLFGFKEMNENNRIVYLFSILSLLVLIGTVSYTISIREDLGDLVPRLHMRYLAPLVIPLMAQCMDFLLAPGAAKPDRRFLTAFLVLIGVSGAAILFLIPGDPPVDVYVDHLTLKTILPLPWLVLSEGSGELPVNLVWMGFKLFMLCMMIGSVILLWKGKRKKIFTLLLLVMLSLNMMDSFLSYFSLYGAKVTRVAEDIEDIREQGSVSYLLHLLFSSDGLRAAERYKESLVSVNHAAEGLEGTIVVLMQIKYAGYIDTYLSSRIIPVDYKDLTELAGEYGNTIVLDEVPLKEALYGRYATRPLQEWDYIIALADENPFSHVEIVDEISPWIILRNLDPGRLHFTDAQVPFLSEKQ